MQMVDVNDYLANVAQIVRKCPTVTLRHAYMRAFREWCQQTQWLKTNVPGATVANQSQYSLGNDPDLDIVGIYAMQAALATTASAAGPSIWYLPPSDSSNWNPNVQAEQPTRYCYIPEAQFALYPTPDQVYTLAVTVILAPNEAAVNVPLAPLVKYSNDIEAGALAYLYEIPGQSWTNVAQADKKQRAFQSGISNGKAETQRNYNTGAQRANPRPFGGGFNNRYPGGSIGYW